MGAKDYPKERLQVFSEGRVVVLDAYKSVQVFGTKGRGWGSSTQYMGREKELEE